MPRFLPAPLSILGHPLTSFPRYRTDLERGPSPLSNDPNQRRQRGRPVRLPRARRAELPCILGTSGTALSDEIRDITRSRFQGRVSMTPVWSSTCSRSCLRIRRAAHRDGERAVADREPRAAAPAERLRGVDPPEVLLDRVGIGSRSHQASRVARRLSPRSSRRGADEIDEAAQLIDETIAAVSEDRAIPDRMPKAGPAIARSAGREPSRRRGDPDASGPLSDARRVHVRNADASRATARERSTRIESRSSAEVRSADGISATSRSETPTERKFRRSSGRSTKTEITDALHDHASCRIAIVGIGEFFGARRQSRAESCAWINSSVASRDGR